MAVMTATGLIAVLLGVRDARKTRTLLPLVLPLSGAMIAFPETFIDVLGCIYYPWTDKNASFHILGREMPHWISIWFGYGALMQTGLHRLIVRKQVHGRVHTEGHCIVRDPVVSSLLCGKIVMRGRNELLMISGRTMVEVSQEGCVERKVLLATAGQPTSHKPARVLVFASARACSRPSI